MVESKTAFVVEREKSIKTHKELANEFDMSKVPELSDRVITVYGKELEGFYFTLSFQNSKLYPAGIRISFGLWSDLSKFKYPNEVNFCQSVDFEAERVALALWPRDSDRFFEKADLVNGGYLKLLSMLKSDEFVEKLKKICKV